LQELVLVGGSGRSCEGGKWLCDQWVFETEKRRWTEVRTDTVPPGGWWARAYDVANDRVVVFNGSRPQTWTLKLNRIKEKR
jgi:hypothetical protein